jgi:EmrB/QacA subfamily drug resistance transporter
VGGPPWGERPPLAALARLSWYRWLVVGTVCVGALLGQLDASIAGLVLPTLEDVFRAPVADVSWVAIAYLLTLAVLIVPIGRLADLAGRKLLYTLGFLVFVCGSSLCGFAPGLGWLIAARVVQAVGAAMLQANSVAIITAAVARRQLGRAIGVQGAAQAVGLAVGPSVGGLVIDALGWQGVFFIAVPFGLLGTVLGWLVLPCTEHAATSPRRPPFDWPGTVLLAPSIGLVFLALTFGNEWGWTSALFGGCVLLAAVGLGAFVLAERRAPSPLVRLELLRVPAFGLGLLAALASYAVLFGALFLMPFYLERVLGFDPRSAGLLLSPLPIAIGVLAPIAGAVTDRVGSRLPMTLGMTLAAVALLSLAVVWLKPLEVTLGLLGLLGVGLGLFTPPNNSAVMGSLPADRLGMGSGVLNMARSLGTSFGVATTGAILGLSLRYLTGQPTTTTLDAPVDALRSAFHVTLFFLAGLAVVAGVVSLARGAPEAEQRAPRRVVSTIGLQTSEE